MAAIADADERLHRPLSELYGYYRANCSMLENLHRDESLSETIAGLFSAFHGYVDGARATLVAERGLRGGARKRVAAAIGHALAFTTWRSLAVEQGLHDDEAAELMRRLVAAAASA